MATKHTLSDDDVIGLANKLKEKTEIYRDYLKSLYNYYYYGSANGADGYTITNLLYGTINQFLAMVYTGDKIILEPRIDSTLDNSPSKEWVEKLVTLLADTISEDFKNTGSNIVLKNIINDGLIIGAGYGKVVYEQTNFDNYFNPPYIIRLLPFNVAVLYETHSIESKQQVIFHKTYVSPEYFDALYPGKLKEVIQKQEDQKTRDATTDIVQQIFPTGTMGNTNNASYDVFNINTERKPQTTPPEQIELIELWYYDFEKKRWIETQLAEEIILKEQEHLVNPFFTVVPLENSLNAYGFSAIGLLKNIQNESNAIMQDVKRARGLTINPPIIASGYNISLNDKEEIEDGLRSPGGFYIVDGASVKIEPYQTGLNPTVAFDEKKLLEQDSQKVMSMTSIMQGVPAENVRSASYAQILAQFSAAPMKSVATHIEAQIEDLFNLLAEIYINNDTRSFILPNEPNATYSFSNLKPIRYGRIVIYAHSTSPIIRSENEGLLLQLASAGIIPKDVLIDILDVPFKDRIKAHIKKKEEEQKMVEQMQAQKESMLETQKRKQEEEKKQHKGLLK
jgi:hypothetical protein